jgi:alpha,alpha-trehalase
LACALGVCVFAAAAVIPQPPQVAFRDLFSAVQAARIYPDSKTFADAVPRESPAAILNQFHAQRPQSPQALRQFVLRYFNSADAAAASSPQPASTARVPLGAHIDALWPLLERATPEVPRYSSALALPKPYVVPGGRFRELYYWDSYFTLLGLAQSGRQDLVQDMIGDFAWLIDTYGHVPNGTRTYYLSRSQPPFFFEMVAVSQQDRAAAWARYLPELRREYAYWMAGAAMLKRQGAYRRVVRLPDGAVLNRYWDDVDQPRDESWREDVELARRSGREPQQLYRDLRAAAESGWDFSARWLRDPQSLASIETTRIIPADLNSLLYGLEQAIRAGCERAQQRACALEFARRAAARHRAIDRYLWDAQRGYYADYRWTDGRHTAVLSAATLYPLFESLASAPQAVQVTAVVRASLLARGGLATSTLTTGQQWDAPNGWAPLQWIAIRGLRDSGALTLAAAIACRWLVNVTTAYQHDGKLVEKYNVVTSGGGSGGEYPLQDGFGWTNGVTRRLLALYPAYAASTSVGQCPDPVAGH